MVMFYGGHKNGTSRPTQEHRLDNEEALFEPMERMPNHSILSRKQHDSSSTKYHGLDNCDGNRCDVLPELQQYREFAVDLGKSQEAPGPAGTTEETSQT